MRPNPGDLTLEDSVVLSEDVVMRELEGEAVLLDLQTSTYFGLDAVGTRIWQLLGTSSSLRKVFEVVLQEYDVEPEILERDLLDLTRQLCAKGLVLPARGADPSDAD